MVKFKIDEYTVFTYLKCKDLIPNPALPFCGHWILGKINNDQRLAGVPLMTEISFNIAMAGLEKKKVVRSCYPDRHYFLEQNVTAV